MIAFAPAHAPAAAAFAPDLASLLGRTRELAIRGRGILELDTIGSVEHRGISHELPRLIVRGRIEPGYEPIAIALFAGIHGDEPAGCWALVELAADILRNPALAAGYELHLFPVVNPTGYEQRSRANHSGKDLNREFWSGTSEAEVQAIERELRARSFAGLITLHADDTCEGVYGYAHGRTLNEELMKPALAAASAILPVDDRAIIDGFPARAGLICDCFGGVLSAPPEQRPKPFDLIFETPAHADFRAQVSATLRALESILKTYPGFIAYAQDL